MLGKHINHCEDSLTASVFTHLLHLPTEVFWRILRNACYTNCLPEYPGEPQRIDFWPKWDAEGTYNNTYVEPDLFIRFPGFDLIIEAKRWDEEMQNPAQWKAELIAYINEYGEEGQPVRMIALGGIYQERDDVLEYTNKITPDGGQIFTCPVHMCRWRGLLYQCKRMVRELKGLEYPSSQTFANIRTLENLAELFAYHGYSTGLWFADLKFYNHHLSPSTSSHLDLFQNSRKQLLPA